MYTCLACGTKHAAENITEMEYVGDDLAEKYARFCNVCMVKFEKNSKNG